MVGKIRKAYQTIKNKKISQGSAILDIFYTLDYFYCKFRYKLLMREYLQYEFHKKTHAARKEYVTEYHVMEQLPAVYNVGDKIEILNNKYQFNEHYKDFLGRDYCLITPDNEQDFVSFMEKYPCAILKPIDACCGRGVEKISAEGKDLSKWYHELIQANGDFLLEEVFIQHQDIAKLNPDSVNTIRIISMINDRGEVNIPFSVIRIGREGGVVDNFCAGGMTATVDAQQGIVVSPAADVRENHYLFHPDTGCRIIGHQIPYWEDVLDTVRRAALMLPSMRFVGWDVVIRHDGKVCLIEGNARPGARIIQMPIGKGVKPVYEKYLGKF